MQRRNNPRTWELVYVHGVQPHWHFVRRAPAAAAGTSTDAAVPANLHGTVVHGVLERIRDEAELSELLEETIGDLASPEALTGGMRACDGVLHVAGMYRVGIAQREHPAMYDANDPYGLSKVAKHFIAGILLNKKPPHLYVDADEQKYWQRVRQSPKRTAREIRSRFRDIDRRLDARHAHERERCLRDARPLRREAQQRRVGGGLEVGNSARDFGPASTNTPHCVVIGKKRTLPSTEPRTASMRGSPNMRRKLTT